MAIPTAELKIYPSMHALAIDTTRQREVFQETARRLANVLPSYKIQEGNVRAFVKLDASNRTLTFKLNNGDGNGVAPQLERLVPQSRVVIAFAASFGICQVPTAGAVQNFGNAVFTNDPNNAIFSAAEITALQSLYAGFAQFKTNGEDRSTALGMQRFLVKSADASDNSIKHTTLQGAYTIVGGSENFFEVKLPATGVITQIGGKADATTTNYAFVDFMILDILAPEGSKEKVLSALSV